jgi:hypothetical protein
MGNANEDISSPVRDIYIRVSVVGNWLFDNKYAPVFSETRHQMLRPLKDKVPPEMTETNDVERLSTGSINMGLGFKIHILMKASGAVVPNA